MTRFPRLAAVLAAALLLAGAGPYTTRLAPATLRHIRTVAVISAVGSSFLLEHVRDTPFEWLGPPDSRFLEISDWGIDKTISRDVSAVLAKRFAVAPVLFQPADFSSWNTQLLRSAAFDLNADPNIDAYVLVLRDWRPDTIGYSVHDIGGLGLYRRDGTAPRSGVFASYRIVVVDAITGETLASCPAVLKSGGLPWLPLSATVWPKSPNDMTDTQRAALSSAETKLIQATLLPTLASLGFAP